MRNGINSVKYHRLVNSLQILFPKLQLNLNCIKFYFESGYERCCKLDNRIELSCGYGAIGGVESVFMDKLSKLPLEMQKRTPIQSMEHFKNFEETALDMEIWQGID